MSAEDRIQLRKLIEYREEHKGSTRKGTFSLNGTIYEFGCPALEKHKRVIRNGKHEYAYDVWMVNCTTADPIVHNNQVKHVNCKFFASQVLNVLNSEETYRNKKIIDIE